jgi:YbgC/YbaW family acyl-CoA thioester hydrolase
MSEPAGRYRHTVQIRYGEVDHQGVVYNAHYMVYMDEAMERWIATFGDFRQQYGWDMMLKKCSLEWQGSAGHNDLLDIDLAVSRWGGSSWSLAFAGSCEGRAVFQGEVLYISVELGTSTPMRTPDAIRQALGEPLDLFGASPDTSP